MVTAIRQSFLSTIFVVFAIDQLSKYWLIHVVGIAAKAPLVLCPYFSLVMTWNRGVSFSLFADSGQEMRWVLLVVALVISAWLLRLGLKTPHRLERIAYGMIVGGALGNALDRLRFGAVADFFYAHIGDLGWPAFNIADSAICIGVGLLLWGMMRSRTEKVPETGP